jgi:hypothetical protein
LDDGAVQDRIRALSKIGVKIRSEVDGKDIHSVFKNRFPRIHWNCPFGKADSVSRQKFIEVLPAFFRSCYKRQWNGDRIHVTLFQEKQYWKKRQLENPLVQASVSSRYRLIRKRRFDNNRYPGYTHVKTSGSPGLDQRHRKLSEFVFEKVTLPSNVVPNIKNSPSKKPGIERESITQTQSLEKLDPAIARTDPITLEQHQVPTTDKMLEVMQTKTSGSFFEMAMALKDQKTKEYAIKSDKENPQPEDYYFECSTDEDSSDYYDSDEDKNKYVIY